MPITLTIAICCHNSSKVVEGGLRALRQQAAEEPQCEILVIDNASSDATELNRIVQIVDPTGKWVRVVREASLGLSAARNRAVEEAQGEYVHFVDDDAVASPGLVTAYLKDLASHPADVIGGNVLPLFEVQPPPGMDQRFWQYWSIRYFGLESRWLNDGEYFIGANIGARRSLLLENRFDEKLGRKGTSLVGSEEVFLGDARWKRRFVAPAYVMHLVSRKRMTASVIAQRRNGHSITMYGRVPLSRVWGGFIRDVGGDMRALATTTGVRWRIMLERLKLRR